MNNQNNGDISMALRIIKEIDKGLELTGDKKVFAQINPGEVQAVTNNLLMARMSVKNILIRLGYDTDKKIGFPPKQDWRG